MKPHIPLIGQTVADTRRELVGVVVSIGPVVILCRTHDGKKQWRAYREDLTRPCSYAISRKAKEVRRRSYWRGYVEMMRRAKR